MIVMSDEQEKMRSGLIHSGSRGMMARSSNLVRRGLDHLSKRETRKVSFPEDWSMGMLYTVDDTMEIYNRGGWVEIGAATGDILVSAGKKLVLELEPREHEYSVTLPGYPSDFESRWFVDLAPLTNLKPDDIQGLDFEYTHNWCPVENGVCINLGSIECLTGLEWLNLWGASVGDLRFLRKLTNLRGLNLGDTNICSLAQLQNLTELRYLSLCYTDIYDLEYLEDLVNLEELQLLETPVWDLSYLKGLSKLRLLDLRATSYDEDSDEVKELKLVLPECEIWL
jgi:hypothetical protein